MNRPIRIGVQIQPQHADYPAIRDAVRRAEDAGVDMVTTWDHFFPLHGDRNGKHFECWTMLAAFAEQTERVQIGALVSSAGYRNPDLLADMARTVDHISGGRLILGIGAGWFAHDYAEYGYDFGAAGSRIALLGRSLPRIKARLAAVNPAPLGPLPIMIGGGGERRTLRLVAEHADIWHAFVDADSHRHKAAVLAEHCAAVGRDPAEIEHSTEITRRSVAEADALADQGVTLFDITCSGPDFDLAALPAWLRWRDSRNV